MPGILQLPDNSYLRGYFQSWKYFDGHQEEVRSRVRKLSNPSVWFSERAQELRASPTWIGVHFRLGNYLSHPEMGVVNEIYYRRAFRLLDKFGYAGARTIVFSDSVETARKLEVFANRRNVEFFDSIGSSRPIETMLLMSEAAALVIGNSTFSWWAAYMGQAEKRPVIYPRPWLAREDFDDRDLFYPEWIGLGRE